MDQRQMRYQLNKLTHGHSTKAERRFAELCKTHHVPFEAKIRINGREVDFLIGKYAFEIDSHYQDPEKNLMLLRKGFVPIHLMNWDIKPELGEWLKQIWQIQHQGLLSRIPTTQEQFTQTE